MLRAASQLSLSNKILLYKAIVVPSMTYCIQLWGTASDSNIMRIQRIQNRALRTITNAPWNARIEDITKDLHIPTVREQINRHSSRYNERLRAHIQETYGYEGDIERVSFPKKCTFDRHLLFTKNLCVIHISYFSLLFCFLVMISTIASPYIL